MSDWIEDYTRWSMKRSPLTPKHFHRNIALSLAAGAIAGRVYLQLPHETIYPNLYTLIIAKTTVFSKTTAFNRAREVVKQTMNEKMLNEIATPEAFVELLAGNRPVNYSDMSKEEQTLWKENSKWGGRRLFMLDEAGRLFNILKRDYNSDLADLFMALYDPSAGSISRLTRKHGQETIKNYALSCLFATTPAGIRGVLSTADAWASGFWIRWNFVAEDVMIPWAESQYCEPPKSVVETLRRLSRLKLEGYNAKSYSMSFEPGFLKAFNENTRLVREQVNVTADEHLHGILGRLPVSHAKAAMIYALLESDTQMPRLTLRHWEATQSFAEGWRRDAELVVELASKSERLSKEEKVEQYVFNCPQGANAREMQRRLHLSAVEVHSILEIAEKMGQMECSTVGKQKLWKIKLDPPKLKGVV